MAQVGRDKVEIAQQTKEFEKDLGHILSEQIVLYTFNYSCQSRIIDPIIFGFELVGYKQFDIPAPLYFAVNQLTHACKGLKTDVRQSGQVVYQHTQVGK